MLLLIIMFSAYVGLMQDEYALLRNRMVENQIIDRGITDQAVIRAMRTVPRHLFIPPDNRWQAYDDRPVPIGYEQTISQPYIVAYMTEALLPEKQDTVLEIGTGSGYQAAVLAEIVSMVYTIEIIKPLAIEASNKLKMLDYKNVKVFAGDGYYGLKDFAPYDAIIVTAAPEVIPPALLDQLKEGGRLVAPVGGEDEIQYLVLVEKNKGEIVTKKLAPVRFVPFTRSVR
jgi:protein-L-isoaspartate(D-aspartate) O-methyltransferase